MFLAVKRELLVGNYAERTKMTKPSRFAGLKLSADVIAALRAVLPQMAENSVAAITVEVPSYADAFSGRMGQNIENAVQLALGAFLRLATGADDEDAGAQLSPAIDGAYELGRGEARSGRTIDALLSAYRVGARVAWRELSAAAVDAGLPAATVAEFAELVFAYIDELSASSVTGHADELATTGRARERYLERLCRALLAGEPMEMLEAHAEQANWTSPRTLTAVLLPTGQVRGVTSRFGPSTLQLSAELPGVDDAEALTALLVPDSEGGRRRELLTTLAGRRAWVGPARDWTEVRTSYDRALRCRALPLSTEVVDAERHLVPLIVGADAEATRDLRDRVLAPLAGLRPNAAERLAETLRSWLLHQGRRDAVAAELFVHPQTVRYRMSQLRELYGDALDDPTTVLELIVALAVPVHQACSRDRSGSLV
jgi:hypothetical protein